MVAESQKKVVIFGAGPAGLTAGYSLTKYGVQPVLIEQLDKVGGIARTENYKNYHFDMGGHRFFTKSRSVIQFWNEFLGDDFLTRPRISRIYYQGKFFAYPLKFLNALVGLGPWQAVQIVISYLKSQLFPFEQEQTFEQWVTNRFGKRLFEIFFKAYTEKVWGISTSELKAEWAAQRIKDLSLKTAIVSMFIKPKNTIKTLIEEFQYPRLGPGMLWERVRQKIEEHQGTVLLNSKVTRIYRQGNCLCGVEISRDGKSEVISGSDFISSMPLAEFIQKLDPPPAEEVLNAAKQLTYRDFLTVCLIINKKDLFPDNWIYVHSPEVHVGRIQNFKNWSADMVPDPNKSSLGLEYFCQEGDEVWNMPDADLIELGKREIDRIGLAKYSDVEDGCVFRVLRAYPVYDSDYRDFLTITRNYVNTLENFQTIGRNGLHQYNNQDHSMITAMMAVRNLMLGETNNLWEINNDHAYHEEIQSDELENPDLVEVLRQNIIKVFPRMDTVAFGLSTGITSGLLLFLATIILVIKDGPMIGANLQLLNAYFPGYHVNLPGSLVGLFYGTVIGFIFGWVVAYLRNFCAYLSVMILDRKIEMNTMRRLLEEF